MRHICKFSIVGSRIMNFYMYDFFAYKITNPIPKDTKFVRIWVDEVTEKIWVVIEHPSFPATEEGDIIPTYGPSMTMDCSEEMFRTYVKDNLLYLAMEKAIEEKEI